jgi:hypothetical protein
MDGVLRCSRYAFGPNRLHFCGPDANREIWDYVNDGFTDFGLQKLLRGFETLYPYLERIARSNRIPDPFDSRVVEAYWVGNVLLDKVDKQMQHDFFIDDLRLKDKLPIKTFRVLEDRITRGILPNHNFHVINVPKKMGHAGMDATPDFMDSCRISWGKVTKVSGPNITLMHEPLIDTKGVLSLGEPVEKKIIRRLEADYDIEMLQEGEHITVHWDVPCEVIDEQTVKKLRTYTLRSIDIANIDAKSRE